MKIKLILVTYMNYINLYEFLANKSWTQEEIP